MKLDIIEIKEFENGDAELICEMDEETKRFLLNYAIIDIIEKQLTREKKLWEGNNG